MNYGKFGIKKRLKGIDAKPVKYGNKIAVILCELLLAGILIIGIAAVGAGVGVMKGIIDSAPDISEIDVIPTGYSTTVLANDGSQIATLVASGANRKYVTIDEIPKDLQHAFIAIEDSRFYEHNGIDVKGILRAAAIGIQAKFDFSQGASTITQQLVKNSVLEKVWEAESSKIERLQRKIQEQYLSIELEAQVNNKDWILENYLNTINLGSNTLGVQTASERYFGKDVSTLSLSECAVIAGITKNPSLYNPILHPADSKKRQHKVLKDMLAQGFISQVKYEEALKDDVYSRIGEHNNMQEDSHTVNSYFTDAMIDDVYNDLINIKGYSQTEAYKAIYQGGLTIYSTQDMKTQKLVEKEVNNEENYGIGTRHSFMLSFQVKKKDGTLKTYTHQTMLSYYKKLNKNNDYEINYDSKDDAKAAIAAYKKAMCKGGGQIVKGSESVTYTLQPEVAMTIMDQSTGEVKAIIGGREKKTSNRNWNRVTDTMRQPGSTFKIIGCFAAALDGGGLNLASTQEDEPFTMGTKTYHNYDGSYRGTTTIREAITDSINIVTVKTLDQIGIDLGYQYAESFGVTSLTETDKNLGLALGGLTKGVTNLQLTGAYAAIANGGEYIAPTFYSKVLDHDGNVLLDSASKERHRVISKANAWLLTSAMQDVMTEGTGRKAYFGDTMDQAGKSGTTTSNRDSLFAGFTPYYTCVLWGGYDDNSKQSSTSYTKLLWHNVMSKLHEGLEKKEFKQPESVTEQKVCSRTGQLAKSGCGSHLEFLDRDHLPSYCEKHYGVKASAPTDEGFYYSNDKDDEKDDDEKDDKKKKKKDDKKKDKKKAKTKNQKNDKKTNANTDSQTNPAATPPQDSDTGGITITDPNTTGGNGITVDPAQ